jgi:hypothetical protein
MFCNVLTNKYLKGSQITNLRAAICINKVESLSDCDEKIKHFENNN